MRMSPQAHQIQTIRHFDDQVSAGALLENIAAMDDGVGDLLVELSSDLDPEEIVEAASGDGTLKIVYSHDGPFSTVRHGSDPLDQSARTEHFDFHTDGLYLNEPPHYCALHCINAGKHSASTVFVDSREVLASLYSKGVTSRALETINQEYVDRHGARHSFPIFCKHPRHGFPVLQYSVGKGMLADPGDSGAGKKSELAHVKSVLDGCVYECTMTAVQWAKHKFVVWDNYTFLHARFASEIDLDRELSRFWLSHR